MSKNIIHQQDLQVGDVVTLYIRQLTSGEGKVRTEVKQLRCMVEEIHTHHIVFRMPGGYLESFRHLELTRLLNGGASE